MSTLTHLRGLLSGVLLLLFGAIYAQEYDSNIAWAAATFPKSHESVKNMVEEVWGADDPNKVASLMELHLTALRNLMDGYEEADLKAFSQALDKWSRTTEEQRMENWWHWPNTNWMKVEEEYKKLTMSNEQ